MSPLPTPPHLLLFDHLLADHLIDRRLHKGCRNPFAIAPALAIVGNELTVVCDVSVELLNRLEQLLLFSDQLRERKVFVGFLYL